MDVYKNIIPELSPEKKYPISGRGDFEVNSTEIIEEIRNEKNESVYLLTHFIDGTYRFDRIANGESGEVLFDITKIQIKKGITNYVLYHNHPRSTESTLSPPSSDDLATAARIDSKSITHKIITEHGIWKFQIIDIKKSQDIAPKLGTLLNYLVGDYSDTELEARIKILNGINTNFGTLALAYKNLLCEENNGAILNFSQAMGNIGFYVDFTFFNKKNNF